jgi:lysophospholipase L1-like esterase
MSRKPFLALALSAGLSAVLQGLPVAHADDDWIATWTASPQPIWGPDFMAPVQVPRNLWAQTVRQVAAVSIGGQRVRVVLSNEYGPWPVKIGAAHIALSNKGAAILGTSDKVLTFGGRTSIVIPPGAPAISDPVDLSLAPLGSVVVSIFLPDVTPVTTFHFDARQTARVVAGDRSGETDFKADSTLTARILLSEILVNAPAKARAIVAFGDSITDGDGSTLDANHRWPDDLARRLVEAGGSPVAVLNQGISGARVLRDRMGVNALARFDRDVLRHRHADTVILMMGINDIGWPDSILEPTAPAPSADDVIAGYQQLITRAHLHEMRILGATLTPFADTFKGSPMEGYYNAAKEAKRQALNKWIRESGVFDGVIDFDAVVRDPKRPSFIREAFDSGDHLHPNDAGYQAMAESIDLTLLAAPAGSKGHPVAAAP